MAVLTIRSVKGNPLTNTEVDDNFLNLNADIGILPNLDTGNQANLVVAINEVNDNIIAMSIAIGG